MFSSVLGTEKENQMLSWTLGQICPVILMLKSPGSFIKHRETEQSEESHSNSKVHADRTGLFDQHSWSLGISLKAKPHVNSSLSFCMHQSVSLSRLRLQIQNVSFSSSFGGDSGSPLVQHMVLGSGPPTCLKGDKAPELWPPKGLKDGLCRRQHPPIFY